MTHGHHLFAHAVAVLPALAGAGLLAAAGVRRRRDDRGAARLLWAAAALLVAHAATTVPLPGDGGWGGAEPLHRRLSSGSTDRWGGRWYASLWEGWVTPRGIPLALAAACGLAAAFRRPAARSAAPSAPAADSSD